MIQQPYCTLRDLDEIGIAAEALAMLAPAHKRRVIQAASGQIAPYMRKRHTLPLRPDVTPADDSGLLGGGTASLAIGNPGPSTVQDIAVKVVVGGTVGTVGVTVATSTDAGVTYGPARALALSGIVGPIDGVTLTLAGVLAVDDIVEWSTRVDFGLCGATVSIAAYLLLNNRGLSPATMESLEKRWEKALKWSVDVAAGDAFLDSKEDATPDVDEAGPFGEGQQNPWDFLDVTT